MSDGDRSDGTDGTVTVDANGGESGPTRLLEALGVRRNAAIGFVTGVVVAVAIFVRFVVMPASTVRSPVYYVALAFVLAMTVGGLVTVILMAVRAYRLSKDLSDGQ